VNEQILGPLTLCRGAQRVRHLLYFVATMRQRVRKKVWLKRARVLYYPRFARHPPEDVIRHEKIRRAA
jgi:hypothetical protein